jgi:hypothetical protein
LYAKAARDFECHDAFESTLETATCINSFFFALTFNTVVASAFCDCGASRSEAEWKQSRVFEQALVAFFIQKSATMLLHEKPEKKYLLS